MKLLRGFEALPDLRGPAVSLGNFDGVHLGHQRIVETLVRRARQIQGTSVVLTFDPPPAALLRPDRVPPRLTTLETKAELLERLGVDALIVYETDHALLNLSPREFFQSIILETLKARAMVEGPNFCFGKDRAGTVETLRQLCEESSLSFDAVEAESSGDLMVSSSEVRRLILQGDLGRATELLGHGYRMTGNVVAGAARGRTLGFPTANLVDIATLLPPAGVYSAITVGGDRRYPAAVHIGPIPTFGDETQRVEAHLVGFEGDLYGQRLSLDLIERRREIVRFADADDLKRQLDRDVAETVKCVESRGNEGWRF